MTAIGYVRQSKRADLDVALSYESQVAAIRRLAQRDGLDPEAVTILADMGRSGAAGKERLRSAYQELLSEVAASEPGMTVYALSMSRLARSLDELRRVYAIAADRGVRIVFDKEGEIAFGTPVGKLHATLVGAVYEFERELAVDRAKENVAIRRRRGERMGRVPYGDRPAEDPQVVVAAYREAGSYNGAARLLNDRGIVSSLGRKWTATSLRILIKREAPALMPRHAARGVGGPASFILARLLRCSCGRFLTGYHHKAGRLVRYKCHGADADSSHPRPYGASESALLPWVKAEAARLALPRAIDLVADAPGRRQELEAQRTHITSLALVPGVDLALVTARLEAVEEELSQLQDEAAAEEVGFVDWDAPAAVLNEMLRAYWASVQLDERMQPVAAEWRVKRMRAARVRKAA